MIHFMDSNMQIPFNQRYFSDRLIACNNMEDRLNQIERFCEEFNHPIVYADNSEKVLSDFKKKLKEREIKEFKARYTLFAESDEFIA